MGSSENVTMRWKVDVSEYSKAMQEVKVKLADVNADFKKATAGMDNWASSTEGVSAKTKQLTGTLEAQQRKLDILKDKYNQFSNEEKASSVQAQKVATQIKNQEAAIAKTTKQISDCNSKMSDLKKASADSESAIGKLTSTIKEQESKLSDLKSKYANVVLEQGKGSEEAKKLASSINNLSRELQDNKSKLSSAKAEAEKLEYSEKKVETASESLSRVIKDQESKLSSLKTEYKNVVLAQGENSSEAKKLANSISDLSGKLEKNKEKMSSAEEKTNKFDKTIGKTKETSEHFKTGISTMQVALGNLISQGFTKAVSAAKDFITESLKVGMNFDSSMSKVKAVSKASSEDMAKLRDKAKEMGASTKFSATESAEAFNYMAMAGWKTEDMLGGIDGIMSLAAASGTDLATTSDIVTDALTAMGYSAKDSGRLADVMAAASSNANTNVEMMGGTFQYVAPVVGALGYSMEDTAVAIGLMANSGIKAEKAGTAMRSWLSRMAAPTKESQEAMDALGISMTNTDGTMKPLSQNMQELREKFKGLTKEQKAQYAKSLAGQEAMSGLLAIVNSSDEDFDKLTNAVANSNGAAKEMADTMQDNLGGDITTLKSKIEGLQIQIFEKLSPYLRMAADFIGKIVDAAGRAFDKMKPYIDGVFDILGEFAQVLGKVFDIIKPYLKRFLGFLSNAARHSKILKPLIVAVVSALATFAGLMTVVVVINLIRRAMQFLFATMMGNPIVLIISAIVGLAMALIYAYKHSEKFRNIVNGAFNAVKVVVKAVIEFIVNLFKNAVTWIMTAWSTVTTFFAEVWNGIKSIFFGVVDFFVSIFKGAYDGIIFAWSSFVLFFQGLWDGIVAIFSAVVGFFVSFFELEYRGATNIWRGITGFFSGIWSGITGIFSNVVSFFAGNFQAAYNNIVSIFSGIGGFFRGLWNDISGAFSSLGTKIGDAIGGAVKAGINGVLGMIEGTINGGIGMINGAIGLINKIPGVEIGYMPSLNLPRLAQGGVLANGARAVIAGEDGAEAIVPLEKNTMWIRRVADELRTELTSVNRTAFAKSSGNSVNIGGSTQTINFYQTINSPKPVDRLISYRETNSLLFGAKARLRNV